MVNNYSLEKILVEVGYNKGHEVSGTRNDFQDIMSWSKIFMRHSYHKASCLVEFFHGFEVSGAQ